MHLTFLDDSLPFDADTPAARALGGAERALIGLATALAQRGHRVSVLNRCQAGVEQGGVSWQPFDGPLPESSDWLIAFREHRYLDRAPTTARRMLWWTGPGEGLDAPASQALLARDRPTVLLVSQAQAEAWQNELSIDRLVLRPGVAACYLEEGEALQPEAARAITTVHPLCGLDWLITLWRERIRPAAPEATLHIYSALLSAGWEGAALPDRVKAILDQAVGAAGDGVSIERPLPEAEMAAVYRAAAVHLYPGTAAEAVCWTLGESQALGLPAVALAGAPGLIEHIVDGQTGIIAANADRFAHGAIELLIDPSARDRLRQGARALRRARSWAVAAAELESGLLSPTV